MNQVKHKILNTKLLVRRIFLIVYDIIAVVLSSYIPLVMRYEFRISQIPQQFVDNVKWFLPFGIITTLLAFYLLRLYHSLWAYAGVTEMQNMVAACALSALFQCVGLHFTKHYVPRSYYFIYLLVLFAFTLLSRFSYRFLREAKHRKVNSKNGTAVMIIGAGDAGNVIMKEIISSYYSTMTIRCVIDDDKNKWGRYVQGIKVVGGRNEIIRAAKEYQIDEIIIALPSVPKHMIRDIIDICKETDCKLRTLPGMYQLVNGEVNVSKIRNVDVEDLLGREPIRVDLNSILEYVKGKVVLVTGGGGSIGSELCRQIATHQPKQLIIVDIYENSAYDIQQELLAAHPRMNLLVLIASVRNTARMSSIFEMYHPDIVYHAAAHKHVPLMEDSPNEAVKNNVFGTWKTAQAAAMNGVKKFVMISTDKAVNPTNVMGATKRICEMIIQTFNRHYDTEFVAVRFGNVLGSNGSVIPLFRKQIEAGGPVTVTHPDIIRYFMTIPEAVSLVLQAGVYAKGGEIFVLDMGEPVKILDLAKNLIRLSGYKVDEDIKIKFTGLRPGEKLYEELLMNEEGMTDTANRLIHIGKPIEFDEMVFFKQLKRLKDAANEESEEIRELVREIVPTYMPKEEDEFV
ncbi:MAG: polysaccharide biosynthesis protein [Lachnospiraceae bacterium]|nr:polysaccharide biosynthesis protein [Lachnospiraceae bacterium]